MKAVETVTDFTIKKVPMNTNTPLHKNFDKNFEKIFGYSGWCVNINGAANSGKTNLLINLFTQEPCKKTGKKRNLEKCFDHIFIVTPNLKSLKKNIFEDIDEKYKFTKLEDFLSTYEDIIENNNPEDADDDFQPETLVIFDDIGNEIRSGGNTVPFKILVANRRHNHISIINLSQRIKQIDPLVRENLSGFITFFLKTRTDEDFIYKEYTKFEPKYKRFFYDTIFKEPYDFLMIDLSGIKSRTFSYFRKFNPVNFIEE